MGLITKNKTWADAENVLYTDLNADFDTLYNEFNGNIDNNNIKSSAGILFSKLDAATVMSVATAQTVSGKKTWTGTIQTITTDTDGSTVTFDMNASNVHKVVLAGNRTLAVSNVAVGQCFALKITQDSTGTRVPTWFAGITWSNGGAVPVLTTTANKSDWFFFICTGANTYDGFVMGQNM